MRFVDLQIIEQTNLLGEEDTFFIEKYKSNPLCSFLMFFLIISFTKFLFPNIHNGLHIDKKFEIILDFFCF
jgi:hypothetical protein